MKIGVITDIHNNKVALETILKVFKEESCDGVICSGDIIGIGAYPEETVKMVMNIPNLIACVRGNHERYLVEGLPTSIPNTAKMGIAEMEYHKWEHNRLSQVSKRFIKKLSYKELVEVKGKRIYVAHYSMNEKNQYVNYTPNPTLNDLQKMFSDIDADIIIYGHDHGENILYGDRVYINCGSLGCPAKDRNIARAGIVEIDTDISFKSIRVEYEVNQTLTDIEKFNFPAKEEIKKFFYGI